MAFTPSPDGLCTLPYVRMIAYFRILRVMLLRVIIVFITRVGYFFDLAMNR